MDCKRVYEHITDFLLNYIVSYKLKGFSIGVSGGIDSALLLAVCFDVMEKHPYLDASNLYGITMPFYDDQHLKDATFLINMFPITTATVWINDIYDAFYNTGFLLSDPVKENLMAKIRMCLLYAHAGEHETIVPGSMNGAENETGFFTKHGDGAEDVSPFIRFLKCQMYELARWYNEFHRDHICTYSDGTKIPWPLIPDFLFTKAPSHGLHPGAIDENQIGPYNFIDTMVSSMYYGISIDNVPASAIVRFWDWHRKTEHKRAGTITPEFDGYFKSILNPLEIKDDFLIL